MHQPEKGIRLRSSARTSIGQVRENNEDNIHLWTHDDFVLAIVADGMGGAAAGEEASRIAVETIKAGFMQRDQQQPDNLSQLEDATITDRLRQTIQAANLSIVQKAATSPEMRGMGTTVTLAFVRGSQTIVAHVGDSRAYLVDGEDKNITQITSDHSFVEALLLAGHITAEQAEDHPMKNVLYRALGQAEDIDVDMYFKRLHVGDRIVLCSDGLTRHVKPEEIAKLSLAEQNPDVISQSLIDLANDRGGEDNVSVIVISVEEAVSAPPPKEVAMIRGADDDETLLLKDRAALRQGLLESDPNLISRMRPEAEPPKNGEPPKATDESITLIGGTLDEQKMTAERMKDIQDDAFGNAETQEGETPVVIEDDPTEPVKPVSGRLHMRTPSPDAPSKNGDHHERQGEGKDTLIPDQ